MKLQSSQAFRPSASATFKPAKKKSKPADEAPVLKKKKVRPVEVDEDDEDDTSEPTPSNRSLTTALGGALAVQVPKSYAVATMLDESEDNEERYKNRRKNTAVMAIPSKLATQASQHEVRGLTTMFGQRADVILNLLESDHETDGALTLLQRTLLQTMVDVLPVVERGVRTSQGQRGVYQLNQCVSQIRELATDIQSLRSRGQLGASVVERVLRPSFLDLAMQIQIAISQLDAYVKTLCSEDDYNRFRTEAIQDVRRSLATYMQAQFEEVKASVISNLS